MLNSRLQLVTLVAAALFAVATLPVTSSAQDAISTDRPGLGFTTALVAPGTVQFEIGAPHLSLTDRDQFSQQYVGFPTAVRVGVADRLEFRLASTVYQTAELKSGTNEASLSGHGDLETGFKIDVWSRAERNPHISLIPSVSIPTGADDVSSNEVSYFVNGVAGWNLPAEISLTTVLGLGATPQGTTYKTQTALAGVLGKSLTDELSGYVEAGVYPSEDEDNPSYTGAGLAYLLSPDVQLDGWVLRGLSDASAGWQFGVGFSARLPQ